MFTLTFLCAETVQPQPLVGGAAEAAGSVSSTSGMTVSSLVIVNVLTAVVAIIAAVAIVFTVVKLRNLRAQRLAARNFSNMHGRLAHSDNMSASFSSLPPTSETSSTADASDLA